MLLAAVALVLVVATANLANAMLAKGMAREGELAIRRAIGGSAGQLARQLLVESAIVGAAGGAFGAAAAAFLLPQLLALIPFGYVPAEAQVVLDWRVVAAATACAVGCGLMIGLVPALRAAAIDPAALLKHGDTRTGSGRRHRWRDAFAAAQLILAVVVLGVAASAWASLRDAVTRDPGYRAAGIWTARIALPSAAAAARNGDDIYARILQRLRETGGVTDAALTSAFPIGELPTLIVSAETSWDGAAPRKPRRRGDGRQPAVLPRARRADCRGPRLHGCRRPPQAAGRDRVPLAGATVVAGRSGARASHRSGDRGPPQVTR